MPVNGRIMEGLLTEGIVIVPDTYPYKATRRLGETSSIYLAGEISFSNRNHKSYVAPIKRSSGKFLMSDKVQTIYKYSKCYLGNDIPVLLHAS